LKEKKDKIYNIGNLWKIQIFIVHELKNVIHKLKKKNQIVRIK